MRLSHKRAASIAAMSDADVNRIATHDRTTEALLNRITGRSPKSQWEVYWHGRWQRCTARLAAWYCGIRTPVRLK